MASLMDTIRQQLQNPKPAASAELGAGEGIASLLRAKSGKAIGPSDAPRQSSLGEQTAARQQQLGQQQLGAEGQIKYAQQAEQGTDIEQRQAMGQKQFEEDRKQQKQALRLNTDKTLNEYETGLKRLDNLDAIKDMEQAGFDIRLNTDKYTSALQQEGDKARLDDKAEFRYQLTRDAFTENETLLMDKLAVNRLMDMDDREFQNKLAEISAQDIITEAIAADRAADLKGKASGASGMLSGILEFFA